MAAYSLHKSEAIPPTWDAKLILSFLQSPGFDSFNARMDAELADLEAKWKHAAPPNALREVTDRPRFRGEAR